MKIPFLSSKWSPKKTPPRRSQSLNNLVNLDPQQRQREFGIDTIDQPTTENLKKYTIVNDRINNKNVTFFFQSFCIFRIAKGPTLKFVNGKWIADGDASGNAAPDGGITQALDSAAASQEMVQLRTDVQRLGDENNMLQLKIEILLDMLTEVQQNKQETQQEMQQRMQAH